MGGETLCVASDAVVGPSIPRGTAKAIPCLHSARAALKMPAVAVLSSPSPKDEAMKIQVVFYTMFGHIYRLAEAVAEGARQVPGAEVSVYQVAEMVPDAVLEK